MTITMDGAGRVVIPKAVREAAGLEPGVPLEIHVVAGRVEIQAAAGRYVLREVNGLRVAAFEPGFVEVSTDQLRTVIEGLRG